MKLLRALARPGAVVDKLRRRRRRQALLSTPTPLRRQFVRTIDQPMILVSQVQRSGGTLVGRLFDGHPACFTYPAELALGGENKSVWPDLGALPDAAAAFELMTRRSLNWIETASAAGYSKDGVATAQQPRPFVFNLADFRRIYDAALAGSAKPAARQLLNAYHTAFFNCWIDNQGFYAEDKRFVVAFTPRINMRQENHARFWTCYPDGYWITIVRDPAGWYASANRHSTAYGDAEEALALWRASAESSLRLKRDHPERVILLRFEDLVTRTEDCMREVCRRTGLAWHPALLTPSFNGMPVESNSSFAGSAGIDARVAARAPEAALAPDVAERLGSLRAMLAQAEGDFDLR